MLLHTTTILARTPALLLSHLSRLPKVYSENTLLFSLSTNLEADDLSSLVSRLTALSADSVGCLSAPLDGPVSPAKDLIACSLAAFSRSTIFRSTLPGRPAPQVGRWHAFRKDEDVTATHGQFIEDERIDWEKVWNRTTGEATVPSELQDLSYVVGTAFAPV